MRSRETEGKRSKSEKQQRGKERYFRSRAFIGLLPSAQIFGGNPRRRTRFLFGKTDHGNLATATSRRGKQGKVLNNFVKGAHDTKILRGANKDNGGLFAPTKEDMGVHRVGGKEKSLGCVRP